MKKSTRITAVVFALLAIADVLCLAFGNEAAPRFIKPLLMPSLAMAAVLQLAPSRMKGVAWLLPVGLAFHTAGDVLLMFRGMNFFVMGLLAFLIGHIFYLCVLLRDLGRTRGWKEVLCIVLPLFLAPLAANAFGLQNPMLSAVSVYAMMLLFITFSGVLWNLRHIPHGTCIIAGGLIFILSDSLIAIKTFAGFDFPLRHAAVMATYLVAESLLVFAMTRRLESR